MIKQIGSLIIIGLTIGVTYNLAKEFTIIGVGLLVRKYFKENIE